MVSLSYVFGPFSFSDRTHERGRGGSRHFWRWLPFDPDLGRITNHRGGHPPPGCRQAPRVAILKWWFWILGLESRGLSASVPLWLLHNVWLCSNCGVWMTKGRRACTTRLRWKRLWICCLMNISFLNVFCCSSIYKWTNSITTSVCSCNDVINHYIVFI